LEANTPLANVLGSDVGIRAGDGDIQGWG
jgi:hypothetical protein